jgi:chromatin remodeling complex protein RSC6
MVSESELIGRLREFLRNSDLDTTTTSIVRRQLESDFGIDLSDRKAFIREQVDLFLQTVHQQQNDAADEENADEPEQSQQEEDDDNEEEEQEEEEEKPKRTRSVKKKTTKKNKSKERLVSFILIDDSFKFVSIARKKQNKNIEFDFFFLSISFHSYLILFLDFFHSCQLPLF